MMPRAKKILRPYVWPVETVHLAPILVNIGPPGCYQLVELAPELTTAVAGHGCPN